MGRGRDWRGAQRWREDTSQAVDRPLPTPLPPLPEGAPCPGQPPGGGTETPGRSPAWGGGVRCPWLFPPTRAGGVCRFLWEPGPLHMAGGHREAVYLAGDSWTPRHPATCPTAHRSQHPGGEGPCHAGCEAGAGMDPGLSPLGDPLSAALGFGFGCPAGVLSPFPLASCWRPRQSL